MLAALRRALVSGELAPGEQVRQESLAERFGVSRVPLREALKILEGEGRVVYLPHRGYFVAELSLDDLLEVYRMRELLEAEAVMVAVPRLGASDLAAISAACEDVRQANRAMTWLPSPTPTGASTSCSSTPQPSRASPGCCASSGTPRTCTAPCTSARQATGAVSSASTTDWSAR